MALLPGNLFTENQQSVETSIDNWASFIPSSSSTATSLTQSFSGTTSIRATYNGTASNGLAGITATASVPQVSANVNYDFWFWVYSPRAVSYRTLIDWYTASNATFVSTTTGVTTAAVANQWSLIGFNDYNASTHLSPATAAQARTYLQCTTGLTTGDFVYMDHIFLGRRQGLSVQAPNSLATMTRAHNW